MRGPAFPDALVAQRRYDAQQKLKRPEANYGLREAA
jgi:hypothetical protein